MHALSVVGQFGTLQIEEDKLPNVLKENLMEIKTRRSFFGKIAAMAAVVISAPKLLAQQAPPSVGPAAPGTASGGDGPRRSGASNHTHNGIYYFSGTGSNDGYPKEDIPVLKSKWRDRPPTLLQQLNEELRDIASEFLVGAS
jgi:hypothetical protein